MISIFATLLLIAKCSLCIPLDNLYPFGEGVGDQVLDPSSDHSTYAGDDIYFEFNLTRNLYVSH